MSRKLLFLLRSSAFFYAALFVFCVFEIYIAAASLYPMAFDEEFHFGLIKIYATSVLPYGIVPTADMAQYGAATADPSYLFHYLLSFPYRLLHGLSLPENFIIVLLRFVNIGFAVSAIILLRRTLLRAGFSRLVIHTTLILYILLPTFSMLSAQINYDNLLLLVFAGCLALIVEITKQARRGKALPAVPTVGLIILVLLGMSVKYAFLPLALGMFAWLLGVLIYSDRRYSLSFKRQMQTVFLSLQRLRRSLQSTLLVATVLSLFFVAHYAVNVAQYRSAIPACDVVFDEESCAAYGPYKRNKIFASSVSSAFIPLSYPEYMAHHWLPGMTDRLTFAVAGKSNDFQTKDPLRLVLISFITLTVIGLFACLVRILSSPRSFSWFSWLTVLLSFTYVATLSWQLYGDYLQTGQPVAINGRYLLPLLPLIGAFLIESGSQMLAMLSRAHKAVIAGGVIAALILFAAGPTTYLVSAEPHWFWPGWGQESFKVLHGAATKLTIGT